MRSSAISTRTLMIVMACGLLFGTAFLSGCGQSASNQDPAALEGVEWTLTESSLSSQNLSAFGINAKFDGTRMTGFSGVNSYTGEYTASTDGTFKAGPLASTLMAGPEKNMAAESAYLKLVESADSYDVVDGKLTLSTGDGATLVYTKAEPFAFSGTSWLVTGYNNGKEAVVSPLLDSELTLAFTDDAVSGNAGVNTFNGTYTSGEGTIEFGPLATTKKTGDAELMTQEQAYLAALAAATKWEVSNGVLTMRDDKGAIQVMAARK